MPLTLHLVPHTHWDREWYLPYEVFRIRLVHLIDRMLDILSSNGAFRHFMLDGQTILIEDYLQIRPERAAEFVRLVRTGRVGIGPWYVLPDEFLAAPESLVRNLMLGDQISAKFGRKMLIGYVPDPFGHVSQLPQILRGFGIESAAFRRGLGAEPAELWWESPDGSRVLACYLRDGYDNAAHLPTHNVDAFVATIQRLRDSLAPHVSCGHVLLLAGTDHQEPQPEIPELVAQANRGLLGADRLICSSLAEYAQEAKEAAKAGLVLETVKGNLRSPQRHHLLPGVLSTRMWIKQRNDAIETLLSRWAEPFSAWAEMVDPVSAEVVSAQDTHLTGHGPLQRVARSSQLIWRAWRLLLENHPHDSICGCSIDQVHREMAVRFDRAEQIVEEVIAQNLAAVADCVDTRHKNTSGSERGASQPVIVFNPIAGPRTDVVTVRLRLPGPPRAIRVVGPAGQTVPHQTAQRPVDAERPLFAMDATPEEVANYISLIEDGRLLNHVIQFINLRHMGADVEIQLVLSERGEPNHAQLATTRSQIQELISSGNVSRFIVRGVVAENYELTFVAPDLPGHGLAMFLVESVGGINNPKAELGSAVESIETDLLSVQVNPVDGTLVLTDKTSGIVYSGLNHFVDGGDRGDEYNYCEPEEDRLIGAPIVPPTIRLVEDGPVRKTLQIAQIYRVPRALRPDRRGRLAEMDGESKMVTMPIVSQVSICPGVPRVDIETTLGNQAQDHRLRVHFPVPARADHAYTNAHYHITRWPIPQTFEDLDTRDWVEQPVSTVPQRGWAAVSDTQAGLMVANRGLPEVGFVPEESGTTIALTLLRCVGWLSRDDLHCRKGHAGPALPTPEAQCTGRHTFHYSLIPFAAAGDSDVLSVQTCAQAEAYRAPLRAVATGVHPGPLPPVCSIIRVTPESFVLTAVKQPEEQSTPGLLVRGVNMSDKPINVRFCPAHSFAQVARVNLNEEFEEPLLADEDGTATVPARPWEIVTLRWRGK
jgi:mannosylglycerate hydrolase